MIGKFKIPFLITVGVLLIVGTGYFGFRYYENYQIQKSEKEKLVQEQEQELKNGQNLETKKLRQEVEALKKQQDKINVKLQEKQIDCASVSLSSTEVQEITNKLNDVNKETGGLSTSDLKRVLYALEAAYKTDKAPSCKAYFDKELTEKEAALDVGTAENPASSVSISEFAKYVVKVVCTDGNNSVVLGSGTIFGLNRFVITNSHVVEGAILCSVGLTDDIKKAPTRWYEATVADNIPSLDIATLQPSNPLPSDVSTIAYNLCNPDNINLGDSVIVLGYPAIGGNTITVTEGVMSGFDGFIVKTSAKIEHGNSGGGAFLKDKNCWFGIPTAATQGELESLGLIVNYSLIHQKAHE